MPVRPQSYYICFHINYLGMLTWVFNIINSQIYQLSWLSTTHCRNHGFKYQLPRGLYSDFSYFTAPFNNLQTLKFKAQLTNAFFATVNQSFSGSSQLPATAEHCFTVWTVLIHLITMCLAVVGSWEEQPSIW